MWLKNKSAKTTIAGLVGIALSLIPPIGHAFAVGAANKQADQQAERAVTAKAGGLPKEGLRKRLFPGDTLTSAQCRLMQTDPRGAAPSVEAELDTFIKRVIQVVQKKDEKGLQALFHKRLSVPLSAIAETLGKLDVVYGKPYTVSIYRLWALNTVDGSPSDIKCSSDAITLFPHHSYPLQFALWLQIMGQNEIGRIYASIVPAEGRWNLGAFHVQQWTHASKDALAWTEVALKTARTGAKEAAYAQYDIASKLLEGGKFYELDAQGDVNAMRDAVMSRTEWEQSMRTALKGYEVLHTSTLFVPEGTGILARLRVPAEISVEDIKSTCHKIAQAISNQLWASPLTGVRCSFNLPHEPMQKDGAMGSIYVSFAEVK